MLFFKTVYGLVCVNWEQLALPSLLSQDDCHMMHEYKWVGSLCVIHYSSLELISSFLRSNHLH